MDSDLSGSGAAAYRLSVLGAFRIVDRQGRERFIRSAKARWLLTYLALHPDGLVNRLTLVATLWDRVDEKSGRASLRQALTQIRDVFREPDAPVLVREGDHLGLDFRHVGVDALELLRCASLADRTWSLDQIGLWMHRLLAQERAIDGAFYEWLQRKQAQLIQRFEALVATELTRCDGQPEDPYAGGLATLLRRVNPGNEIAVRWLMRKEALAGNVVGAVTLWEALGDYLRELDVKPSEQTVALVREIREGALSPAQRTRPDASPPVGVGPVEQALHVAFSAPACVKVAIMPLRDLAADMYPGRLPSHLWTGTAEELRTRMSSFRTVSVLSSGVSEAIADKPDSLHLLREQLGIQYVFEGTIVPQGPGFRLHAGVVRTADGMSIWRQRFDFELGELLDVHDRVLGRLTASIDQVLTKAEIERTALISTDKFSAFDCWAAANKYFRNWDDDSDRMVSQLLHKALSEDEDYVNSLTMLSGVINSKRFLNPADPITMRHYLSSAEPHARKAVEKDPHYARSRVAWGWVLMHQRQFEQAWVQFTNAVDLNPYDTDTLMASAVASAFLERPLSAERLGAGALAERAMALCPSGQPDYYHSYRAMVLYLEGRPEEAIASIERATNPMPGAYAWLAAAYDALDRRAESDWALAALHDGVRASWCGAAPPDRHGVLQWLEDVTPIRPGTAARDFFRRVGAGR